MTLQKLSREKAEKASYSDLLGQAKWVKDDQGRTHRVKDLDLADTLRTMAWLHEQAWPLFQVSIDWDSAYRKPDPHLWLTTSPLWRRLAATAMSHLTPGVPRQAYDSLLTLTGRKVVMVTSDSFFAGDGEDLPMFQAMLSERLAAEAQPFQTEEMHP